MQGIATICLDVAKSVFQVHGVNAEAKAALCRQLKRRYVLASFQKLPYPVGIEARCEPVDAEAICVAVTRATSGSVSIQYGT